VRIISAPWLFRTPWFRRFDGYTIWSTILLRSRSYEVDDDLVAHELVHVWQGQHEWVRLWMSYVKPSTFWGDRSGYWENRYERQARAAVAQTRPGNEEHQCPGNGLRSRRQAHSRFHPK
jgi:hypothetical protein